MALDSGYDSNEMVPLGLSCYRELVILDLSSSDTAVTVKGTV